jgi:hypothetical protein
MHFSIRFKINENFSFLNSQTNNLESYAGVITATTIYSEHD